MIEWFNKNGDRFLIGLIAIIAVTVLAALKVISGELATGVITGVIGGAALIGGGKKTIAGVAIVGMTALIGCSTFNEQAKEKGLKATQCLILCAQQCAVKILNEPAQCGIKTIAGGEIVTDQKALVRVYDPANGHSCSGALITSRAILTAAHCATKRELMIDVWGAQYRVANRHIHNVEDIALLIINQPARTITGKLIMPYKLYGGDMAVGEKVTLLGWGHRRKNDSKSYLPNGGITAITAIDGLQIRCSGPPGVCDGDSGGALLYGRCLAGIHIRKIGECGENSVSIRVVSYLGWIKSVLQGMDRD